jgi:hypothetical protein
VNLKLLDYHRLRREEEQGWNRDALRREAGPEFVAVCERLLPAFEWKWNRDYLVQLVRLPWFEDCLELCGRYAAGSDAQRTWLRSRIDREFSGKLGVFALHAAVLAAREHSVPLARAALIAFAMVDLCDHDVRDVMIGLSLLCHCAGLAGADVPALLREVAALSGAALGTLLGEWADLYPGVPHISSMGLKQVETEDGVGFRM